MEQTFKDSVIYQIYPKSFMDTDGDGWGDLRGVTARLDYLETLGVDYIWMTPFFPSPQRDNGYDVADYYSIDPRYGTMEDLETLIDQAGRRGIGIMLDMVFNHVSTEHPWFQKALAGDPAYQDYFFFRKGRPNGQPPTNWESKFGGSAWAYVPELDRYYLHLFDVGQADLNWENPQVRKALQDVIRFWMHKGVKGFRFDVVNLISKGALEDDPDGDGRRFYTDGPKVHAYLQELNAATFGTDARILTVGEMSSTTIDNCCRYAGADSHELSMVFNFHHLKVDFMGNEKWVLVPADFMQLKKILFDWQKGMAAQNAWNAVFWCNHDQPRVVSRFGDEGPYWKASAKMLATLVHCLRGTPYIYQGEELDMTNAGFTDISQYRDVESLNHFQILQDKGLTEADAYRILQIHSRDNSRTPMQWSDDANGGFAPAGATPWIGVNPNYTRINAAQQLDDPDSIFHYYRQLIALRKTSPAIADGDITPLAETHPQIFAYTRCLGDETILVAANFYSRPCTWSDAPATDGAQWLLGNYPKAESPASLRPYEVQIWRWQA